MHWQDEVDDHDGDAAAAAMWMEGNDFEQHDCNTYIPLAHDEKEDDIADEEKTDDEGDDYETMMNMKSL